MYDMFGFLAVPLGWIMRFMYEWIGNYGWTIILFTILVRVLMFPLSLKQQKSSARQAAYQPMIQEIQKKWANDRNRQGQEMQKFYDENNIKMTAGCLPAVINMVVLFGIIAVIQAPLTYIVGLPAAQSNIGIAIVQNYQPDETDPADVALAKTRAQAISQAGYRQQSYLIGDIKADPQEFLDGAEVPFVDETLYVLKDGESVQRDENGEATMIVDKNGNQVKNTENLTTQHVSMAQADVDKVVDFNFNFLGLDLSAVPTVEMNRYLIMPILSVLTMFLSQFIIMKFSGTASMQQGKSMLIMTLVMGAMFGYFAFTVPVGFSLYYTASNLVMTVQQLVVKRVYDPEKIKAQVIAEIEERKNGKKAKKVVAVKDESGQVVEKELSEAELAKLRLQKAREQDLKRYGDLRAEADSAGTRQAAAKAKAQDDEKYGAEANPAKPELEREDEGLSGDGEDQRDPATEEMLEEQLDGEAGEETPKAEAAPKADAEAKQDYKPGRRKRARQNKEKPETSFAGQEQKREQALLEQQAQGAAPTHEEDSHE